MPWVGPTRVCSLIYKVSWGVIAAGIVKIPGAVFTEYSLRLLVNTQKYAIGLLSQGRTLGRESIGRSDGMSWIQGEIPQRSLLFKVAYPRN